MPRPAQDQPSHEEATEFRRDMERSAWLNRDVPGFRPGVDYDEVGGSEDNEE
jgi:hypothetical protein